MEADREAGLALDFTRQKARLFKNRNSDNDFRAEVERKKLLYMAQITRYC